MGRTLRSLRNIVFGAALLLPGWAFAQDVVRIVGTVVDQTGAIIPDAEVTLKRTGYDETRKTLTDGIGWFRFPGTPPGEYTLIVSASGFSARTVGKLNASGPVTKVAPVVLDVASTGGCAADALATPRLSFAERHQDDPVVSGLVVRSPVWNLTMPGVRIVLATQDHGVAAETLTDSKGSFEFRGVLPGSYTLRASLTGYTDFLLNDVDVRLGQITRIEPALEMEPCPKGIECNPNQQVHIVAICL